MLVHINQLHHLNGSTPISEALSELDDLFLNELSSKVRTEHGRREIRDGVWKVVEKIMVNTKESFYTIHFIGTDKTIKVKMLTGGGWTVNGKTYKRSMDYRTGKDLFGKE